ARLRAPPRPEPRCGRGPPRRYDVPGLPPHDSLDGGRTDSARRRHRDRLLRQLLCDPGSVTQPSLFGEASGTDLAAIVVYCDGGRRGTPGPAASGAVVLDPASAPPRRLATVSERIGIATNNVAEYRALIAGLEAAAPYRARRLRVRADSKLVVEQVKGAW